jgi:uncharacterized protein YqhQ
MARTKLLEVPFVRGFIAWFVDSPTERQWAVAKLEEELEQRDTERGSDSDSLPPPRTRSAPRVILAAVAACAVPQIATDASMRALGITMAPATPLFAVTMLALIVAVVIVYCLLVARAFPDVRRALQYNAAFKMAVWSACEEREPTVATIARNPTWNYCSTFVALLLDAVALTLLPAAILALVSPIRGAWVVQHGVVLGTRLLLLPLVVSFVDEGLRFLIRVGRGAVVRALFTPLALFDGLVARAPTESELAVAVAALRELRRLHRERPSPQG